MTHVLTAQGKKPITPRFHRTMQPFGGPSIIDLQVENAGRGHHKFDWNQHIQEILDRMTEGYVSQREYTEEYLEDALAYCWDKSNPYCKFFDKTPEVYHTDANAHGGLHDDHHCLFCRRWQFFAIWNELFGKKVVLTSNAVEWILTFQNYTIDEVGHEDRGYGPELFGYKYWTDLAREQWIRRNPAKIPEYMKTGDQEKDNNLRTAIGMIASTRFDYINNYQPTWEAVLQTLAEFRQDCTLLGWSLVYPYIPVYKRPKGYGPSNDWETNLEEELIQVGQTSREAEQDAWKLRNQFAELQAQVTKQQKELDEARRDIAELREMIGHRRS